MSKLISLNLIFFILMVAGQQAHSMEGNKDFTSNDNTYLDTIADQQTNLSGYLEQPRLGQQSLSIPIDHFTQQLPPLTEYLATKSIYPNAAVPETSIPIQIIRESQKSISADGTQIDNSQKQIVWKIAYVAPLSNYVLSDGVQTPLTKAQTITSTGQAILAIQGVIDQKPITTPVQNIPINLNQRQGIESSQKKQQGFDFEPSKRKPISSFETNNAPSSSPGSPDSNSNTQQKQKTIQQLQNLLDKSHRWSIILVILLLALIFSIFLFIRYQRSKKTNSWRKNNPKLDKYRNSVAVGQKQQQDIDFHEVENVDIDEQFEDID